jgi:BlaI family penicillinase repressor
MPRPPKPTDAELAILHVLWEHGPSTVREVHDHTADSRAVGYTTTLKMLQVMTKKGLTLRETVRTQHLYRAHQGQRETQRRLLRDLLDRAFGGSVSRLVVQALASKRASPEELREIRRLLAVRTGEDHD